MNFNWQDFACLLTLTAFSFGLKDKNSWSVTSTEWFCLHFWGVLWIRWRLLTNARRSIWDDESIPHETSWNKCHVCPFCHCRNQRDSVHLCGDGSRARPCRHALLQPGQHDRVRLRCSAAGRRLSSRGLALGRLLRSHPVRDVVQPQVHGPHREEHVDEPQ